MGQPPTPIRALRGSLWGADGHLWLHRLRIRIEAFFRDAKQHFDLERCRLQTGARICAPCCALSLAFWWLALQAPLSSDWKTQVRIRGKLSWLTLTSKWLDSLALQRLFDALPDPSIPLHEVSGSGQP